MRKIDIDAVEIPEQLTAVLNKEVDTMTELFNNANKEIQEVTAAAHKRIAELKETLLKENEEKYVALCDKALEMEKEPDNEKIQEVLGEVCFANCDDKFFERIFNGILLNVDSN